MSIFQKNEYNLLWHNFFLSLVTATEVATPEKYNDLQLTVNCLFHISVFLHTIYKTNIDNNS